MDGIKSCVTDLRTRQEQIGVARHLELRVVPWSRGFEDMGTQRKDLQQLLEMWNCPVTSPEVGLNREAVLGCFVPVGWTPSSTRQRNMTSCPRYFA